MNLIFSWCGAWSQEYWGSWSRFGRLGLGQAGGVVFFFRVFQAGEGKRKAREEAPDTGKRLQGEAEQNNAYPYIIDCSIPPPNTPLNDATKYSGSSKRSNCQ